LDERRRENFTVFLGIFCKWLIIRPAIPQMRANGKETVNKRCTFGSNLAGDGTGRDFCDCRLVLGACPGFGAGNGSEPQVWLKLIWRLSVNAFLFVDSAVVADPEHSVVLASSI
jgi:hypothetical protein